MKRFTELYIRLDQTNSTNEKIEALIDYFTVADDEDAAWAIWFLSGERLKRLVKRATLRQALLDESGYPDWMLDESYQAVGDIAETIALLLPEPVATTLDETSLAEWVTERLEPLGNLDPDEQRTAIRSWWRSLTADGRFVMNKLLTGALRVGVSRRLVVRALAKLLEQDPAVIAHRLMGGWQPHAALMSLLADESDSDVDIARPYPFYLASPLQDDPNTLGDAADWLAEWKWDGIRAQLIRRDGTTVIWSRGEDRMDGRFPELETVAQRLPDGVVLDGEILAYDRDNRYDFSLLQRRIGRRKPGKQVLSRYPVRFMAYDLLEYDASDLRARPLIERRRQLEAIVSDVASNDLLVSASLEVSGWAELAAAQQQSRGRGVEGLMLKQRQSSYGTGRQRGSWWKWKVEPYHRRCRAALCTAGIGAAQQPADRLYVRGVEGDSLVPVCKAYSGLTNEEIAKLDRWIRAHTTERFGPVRAVEPQHVFEIAFDSVQRSTRHKSGVAFRFPRIARWREDLSIADADTLPQIEALIGGRT